VRERKFINNKALAVAAATSHPSSDSLFLVTLFFIFIFSAVGYMAREKTDYNHNCIILMSMWEMIVHKIERNLVINFPAHD
jgi:hypothetical protein